MPPNGPAIKGGCVTRRKHRADPGTLARKLSRCKEGMARVFAVMAGAVWSIRVSRYKVAKQQSLSPEIVCRKWALARSRFKHYEFVLVAGTIAKTVTTAPAVAFFDLRSFSEGGSEGWTTYLYCPCYVLALFIFILFNPDQIRCFIP
jgi:hypothetical protein